MELLHQAVRYGVIGLGCAGADGMVFALLCGPLGWAPGGANLLSVHLGIVCSFFLHRRVTFRQMDRPAARFLRFYLVGLGGLLLSQGTLWAGLRLGLPLWLDKLAATGGAAAVQFLLNRKLTFRGGPESQ